MRGKVVALAVAITISAAFTGIVSNPLNGSAAHVSDIAVLDDDGTRLLSVEYALKRISAR